MRFRTDRFGAEQTASAQNNPLRRRTDRFGEERFGVRIGREKQKMHRKMHRKRTCIERCIVIVRAQPEYRTERS